MLHYCKYRRFRLLIIDFILKIPKTKLTVETNLNETYCNNKMERKLVKIGDKSISTTKISRIY